MGFNLPSSVGLIAKFVLEAVILKVKSEECWVMIGQFICDVLDDRFAL